MKPFLSAIIVTAIAVASTPTGLAETAYKHEVLAEGLNFPWSAAFLPDGRVLVAQLSGELRILDTAGDVSAPIAGVPTVYRAGQGGLFDVSLDPAFTRNQFVYLSYAAGDSDANGTTVTRARLQTLADGILELTDAEIIFTAAPKKYAPLHYGGRLAWLPDETLLLTTGDGFDFREKAQDVGTHFGKTIRMNRDGSPPAQSPFTEAPLVWSYGHRNPQGLAVRSDGTVFQHEHGPAGGDEVNVIVAGNNYGWPAITYGMDYNGAYVSPFTELPDMQQPIHKWVPSIAPSGLMIYEGSMFPEWRGDLFVGALVDAEVRRLDMQGDAVQTEAAVFPEIATRIRDIREAPDGSIYVLTDGPEGQVVRISR